MTSGGRPQAHRRVQNYVRYRVFDYMWHKKGVRSRDLGVRPYHANKVKNRRQRVSDDLLRRMLEMLSPRSTQSSSKGFSLSEDEKAPGARASLYG